MIRTWMARHIEAGVLPARICIFLLLAVIGVGWGQGSDARGAEAGDVVPGGNASSSLPGDAATWGGRDEEGQRWVRLYFFWSDRCPHCHRARPVMEALAAEHPWLRLESHEVRSSESGRALFLELLALIGEAPSSVPAFVYCGQVETGWGGDEDTAPFERRIAQCYTSLFGEAPVGVGSAAEEPAPLDPGARFGIDTSAWSLPMLTLMLAGMDAFNPCAFFVLLFLLSLLVHTRRRSAMLLVGGVYVTISGVVYFAFMAAWLNVFLWLGELEWMTLVAGSIAVVIAVINIKDYFWFKAAVSLSISEGHRKSLIQRMRSLLRVDHVPTVLAGTVALALFANLYELLCTAGFPMVYTRILTMRGLSATAHYGYLALYNVIYVIPLFIILLAFVRTLGSRKLQESEGRTLKLVSGVMMLGLGAMLLAAPELLDDPLVALGLIAVAIAAGALARLRHGASAGSE